MKRLLLLTLLATCSQFLLAQNSNPWPLTGNVGIGTTNPAVALHVENGTALINKDVLSGVGGQLSVRNGYGNQNGAVRLNLNNGGAVSWISGIVTGANTNSGSAMVFGVPSSTAEGTEMMRITGSGLLGLGTNAPAAKLHVENGDVRVNNNNLANLGGQLTLSNGYGNQNGAVRLNLNNGGAVSWIKGIVTGANTSSGSAMVFGVPSGTSDGSEAMRLTGDGFLGIGTANPDAKLAVNGMIHAREVKVDMNILPDYVFEPTYKLSTLTEIKMFVDKYHHLPEVPSAEEVAKEGMSLGEMNVILLKKIEELTLHLIEKDRQMADYQLQVQKQNVRTEAIEKLLIKLMKNKR